ncbi:hypothetical protein, partial [Sporofaciens musculi]|uniref:hypothetical protein n=1 Tax=Sporofaciens musculi TaxID=2681861 RepID=UPI0025A2A321
MDRKRFGVRGHFWTQCPKERNWQTFGHSRAVDKPPNFVNVTRYHDKNPAKIAEIFQRKRS